MALQQFVRFFTVMIILLHKGFHSQSLECGRMVGTQAQTPGSWPWQVFILKVNDYPTEGSLITDQWVLTLARTVQYHTVSGITVHLGPIRTGSSPNLRLEKRICDPGNGLCLLKLASPVNLTDQVQPICLASENSTFYAGTESWATSFSAAGTGQSNLEIVGKRECECYHRSLPKNTICAGLKGRKTACLGNWGGALMNKNNSIWVQSGVLSSYEGCSVPTKAAGYVRVSQYQKWINDTVTGTPPGFVTFTSPGPDSDLNFTCFIH